MKRDHLKTTTHKERHSERPDIPWQRWLFWTFRSEELGGSVVGSTTANYARRCLSWRQIFNYLRQPKVADLCLARSGDQYIILFMISNQNLNGSGENGQEPTPRRSPCTVFF